MIIAKLPFGEFLPLLRESGRRSGFSWLIIFIAREADCSPIFKELEEHWSSLHDLTGTKILFLTIDGTEHSPVEGWNHGWQLRNDIGHIDGSYGTVIYSPECRLWQNIEDNQYNSDSDQVKPWIIEDESVIQQNIKPRRRDEGWRDQQSLGISRLINPLKKSVY